MSVAQTIRRDSASYRQGVVLGLTMAETLLLLVFCLLIAAASTFTHKLKQVKDLEAAKQSLDISLQDARSTIELMQSHAPDGAITDEWKRIVRVYGPAIQKMEKAGVPIKEAGDAADDIAELMKARKEGLTSDEVTGSIELTKAIKDEFSGTPGGVPKSEQIVSLIREGLQAQTAKADSPGSGKHKWPPIITLSEADGKYFDTGSAVLSDKFRAALTGSVMDELLRNIAAYPEVNVIEVIGHTDEQPLAQQSSNLDALLMPVLQGKASVVRLKPADNAGLGLARAVSVSQVLLEEKRLSRFAVLPYSGAQLVNVNDSLVLAGIGGDVKERRRIEIRLRQSDKVHLPVASPAQPPAPERATKPAAPPSSASDQVDTAVAEPKPTVPGPEPARPPAKPARPAQSPANLESPFRWFFRN